jgi:hypothetical protein
MLIELFTVSISNGSNVQMRFGNAGAVVSDEWMLELCPTPSQMLPLPMLWQQMYWLAFWASCTGDRRFYLRGQNSAPVDLRF